MKKLLSLAIVLSSFTLVTNAQSTEKAPQTKEEKAKIKAQKEADLTSALKQLGITEDQENQVRDVLKNADQQSKDLKADATLSDEEKASKKEGIMSDKNQKLKVILGEEKFKTYNSIRKKQREAAEAANAGH